MKIIFAGTPEFAIPALEMLLHSAHTLSLVVTQPDRPAGRGQKLTATPVKTFALAQKLPLLQPQTLRDTAIQQQLRALNADILVDVACGLFLPAEVLNMPKFGCINIHPSLLPRWRGAAPIQRAILAGDAVTGVSIMQMDAGLDTGPILQQSKLAIEATDTAGSLNHKLAQLGAKLLLDTIDKIAAHDITPISQNDALSCYAEKITKESARINWDNTAIEIDRAIRGYNPWPIAHAMLNNVIMRIWEAVPLAIQPDNSTFPGTIIKATHEGIDIATGNGYLRLLKIQFPGGKPLKIADAINAHYKQLAAGVQLR